MEQLTVLVVDDEPGMRRGVARVLERHVLHLPEGGGSRGFQVLEAHTGEEAWDQLLLAPPDLMLLDYKLPGLSGLDLLARLADRPVDCLTIVITAYATLETAVRATKRGAFDLIAKPFTPEELRAVVDRAARQLLLQRHAKALVEERRQVRFQLISVLAHELRAPLAAVQGWLQVLAALDKSADPQQVEQILGRCQSRIDSMQMLIRDLLDLTRIESGRWERRSERLAVHDVLTEVVSSFEAEASGRQIRLVLELTASWLVADRRDLVMIASNLISNAIKYNRERGRVTVSLSPLGDGVRIAVSDTGIGMAQQETARVFGEFARIRSPKTEAIWGSGLGLSIVRKLVGLYSGDVTVESVPDQGTTFKVVLHSARIVSATGEGDDASTVEPQALP